MPIPPKSKHAQIRFGHFKDCKEDIVDLIGLAIPVNNKQTFSHPCVWGWQVQPGPQDCPRHVKYTKHAPPSSDKYENFRGQLCPKSPFSSFLFFGRGGGGICFYGKWFNTFILSREKTAQPNNQKYKENWWYADPQALLGGWKWRWLGWWRFF